MTSDSPKGQGEATSAGSFASVPASEAKGSTPSVTPLVMQLILPRRLPSLPGWSTGPLIAQGAHATAAILALTSDRPLTREYLSPEGLAGGMHKVVLQFPAKEAKKTKKQGVNDVNAEEEQEEGLEVLSRRLTEARDLWKRENRDKVDPALGETGEEFPPHTMWIEQPEGVPTCIAIAPNRRPAALKKILNKCTLFRG